MSFTEKELAEKLKQLDEITLLELLEINSEDIVDRFMDYIEDRRENFEDDLEDEELDYV